MDFDKISVCLSVSPSVSPLLYSFNTWTRLYILANIYIFIQQLFLTKKFDWTRGISCYHADIEHTGTFNFMCYSTSQVF